MITIDATGLVTGGTGGHGLRSPGSVVQTLQTVKTDTSSVTSVNSFEDISGMSVAITPTSTTSKVLVTVDMRLGTNSNRNITYRLMRGSTQLLNDQFVRQTSSQTNYTWVMEKLDSPSTTSSTTYKIQFRAASNEVFINRDGSNELLGTCTITALEID